MVWGTVANPKNKVHILIPQIQIYDYRTLCRPTAGYPNNDKLEFITEISPPYGTPQLCKTCEKYSKDIDKGEWNEAWAISDKEWEDAGGVI